MVQEWIEDKKYCSTAAFGSMKDKNEEDKDVQ
jgi:hypothetical protein